MYAENGLKNICLYEIEFLCSVTLPPIFRFAWGMYHFKKSQHGLS